MTRPLGSITRGTTHPNRLRRVDRWLVHTCGPTLRRTDPALVVDLGFGSSPTTTVELADRLQRVRADIEVVGLEIDPDRVAAAAAHARPGLSFTTGGFEIPTRRQPDVIRAFNVLRPYDEVAVEGAWATMRSRLSPGGVLVEGTCDEPGRRAAWAALHADDRDGVRPRTLTLAARLADLGRPSDLAERLPKALIHRNVPGEPVHDLLRRLDAAWATAAPYASFGARQRWSAMARLARERGVAVLDGPSRWRLGEITVAWPGTLSAP